MSQHKSFLPQAPSVGILSQLLTQSLNPEAHRAAGGKLKSPVLQREEHTQSPPALQQEPELKPATCAFTVISARSRT